MKSLQKRSEKLNFSMRICIAGTVLCLLTAPNVHAAELTVPQTSQEQTEVTEQQPAAEQSQPEKEEPAPVKKTTVKLKAPKMTKADASYKKTITIRWKKVKNADGYFIYRKTGKGSYKKIATVKKGSTTSYTNKKVALQKTYSYKVAAYKKVDGKIITGPKSSNSVSAMAEVYIGKKGMAWPCPSSKRITSYYGRRSAPTRGASTFHRGIDIGANHGAAILSVASGKVTEAGYSRVLGNYVKINHGDGLYTVYEHASKLLVSEGDTVKYGQKIAKVGSTGLSTGNHLHFTVIYKGDYQNPLNYLDK